MSKGRKQITKGGDEFDIVTGWRKLFSWSRGDLKRIKRKMNKRDRKDAKQTIKKEIDEQ